jgi:hypothetical protein
MGILGKGERCNFDAVVAQGGSELTLLLEGQVPDDFITDGYLHENIIITKYDHQQVLFGILGRIFSGVIGPREN